MHWLLQDASQTIHNTLLQFQRTDTIASRANPSSVDRTPVRQHIRRKLVHIRQVDLERCVPTTLLPVARDCILKIIADFEVGTHDFQSAFDEGLKSHSGISIFVSVLHFLFF